MIVEIILGILFVITSYTTFNQFRKVMKESKRRNLLPCNGCDIDGQAAGKFW